MGNWFAGAPKGRALLVVSLLLLAANLLPSSMSGGPGAEVGADVGGGDDGGSSPPPPRPPDSGLNEPANDVCDGAIPMEVLTHGTYADRLGISTPDPADWAAVSLLRTESLSAAAGGAASVLYAEPCDTLPLPTPPTMVGESGYYELQVTGAGPYELAWTTTPNDNFVAGYDIGHTTLSALPFNALPTSMPQLSVFGGLPARADQPLGPDKDWFRLNTPLAEVPTNGTNVTLGLLTAILDADCYDGLAQLQFYQANGILPIGDVQMGCHLTQSCISLGLSAVYAEASTMERGRAGTGYEFSASVSPLYFVWLDQDTGSITLGNLAQDLWCDPLIPTLIGILPFGNALVDANGSVVALVPKIQLP